MRQLARFRLDQQESFQFRMLVDVVVRNARLYEVKGQA